MHIEGLQLVGVEEKGRNVFGITERIIVCKGEGLQVWKRREFDARLGNSVCREPYPQVLQSGQLCQACIDVGL
jgi:hypothetical protein